MTQCLFQCIWWMEDFLKPFSFFLSLLKSQDPEHQHSDACSNYWDLMALILEAETFYNIRIIESYNVFGWINSGKLILNLFIKYKIIILCFLFWLVCSNKFILPCNKKQWMFRYYKFQNIVSDIKIVSYQCHCQLSQFLQLYLKKPILLVNLYTYFHSGSLCCFHFG